MGVSGEHSSGVVDVRSGVTLSSGDTVGVAISGKDTIGAVSVRLGGERVTMSGGTAFNLADLRFGVPYIRFDVTLLGGEFFGVAVVRFGVTLLSGDSFGVT